MKRNYRNASAYGRSVRFLRGAWGAMAGGAVAALCYMALVLALVAAAAFETGCSSGGGAAGTPDSVSVDMVGGGTDASLTEVGADSAGGDAGNTDTVGVDNGADSATDAADSTDSGSPDVGEDVAKTCPPPNHPDRVVETKVNGQVECVPSTVWKACLEVLPGKWNKTEQDGDACDQLTVTMLPSSFQPNNMGWAELPSKPVEYDGLPIIAFKCEGFSKTRYYALKSCVESVCEAVMPDWKEQDFGSKLSVSLVSPVTITETEWPASTKKVDATRVFQK